MAGKSTNTQPGRLEDRIALITGGTSGIGRATALLFARERATVIITGGRRRQHGQVAPAIASSWAMQMR